MKMRIPSRCACAYVVIVVAIGVMYSRATFSQMPPSASASELQDEIKRAGSARVIVELAVDLQGPADAAAIRVVQDRLLASLAATEHTIVFRFPSTALVALIIGPDALKVLLSSPLVKSIMRDAPRTPASAAQ
jgi:hypothetical protein